MNQIIKNTIILFVITLVAGICLGTIHYAGSDCTGTGGSSY